MIIDGDTLIEIRKKVQKNLLDVCKRLYYSELALCEPYAPDEWKDNNKKIWDEWVWTYQDYELVNESDKVDENELNYDYII